ncbi:hypothetical protein, partial [Acinetobacter nosocomialis]|uniref:hypothetical protein n=1 Tax=Acinetobacter nosocomialis TaxID=106654 RepID=UPI00124DF7A1
MAHRSYAIAVGSALERRIEPTFYYKELLRLLDDNAPPSSFEQLAEDAKEAASEGANEIGEAVATAVRLRANFE